MRDGGDRVGWLRSAPTPPIVTAAAGRLRRLCLSAVFGLKNLDDAVLQHCEESIVQGQPKMSAVMLSYQVSASLRVCWRTSGLSPTLLANG